MPNSTALRLIYSRPGTTARPFLRYSGTSTGSTDDSSANSTASSVSAINSCDTSRLTTLVNRLRVLDELSPHDLANLGPLVEALIDDAIHRHQRTALAIDE
jgi:hypothetical protein